MALLQRLSSTRGVLVPHKSPPNTSGAKARSRRTRQSSSSLKSTGFWRLFIHLHGVSLLRYRDHTYTHVLAHCLPVSFSHVSFYLFVPFLSLFLCVCLSSPPSLCINHTHTRAHTYTHTHTHNHTSTHTDTQSHTHTHRHTHNHNLSHTYT